LGVAERSLDPVGGAASGLALRRLVVDPNAALTEIRDLIKKTYTAEGTCGP
jgi:hypothetical protein